MSGFSLRREVTLGLAVYALYLLVARHVLRRDGRARARRNAERIVALEERLGIDVEPAVQRALLRYPRLVHGLNLGYGLLNVTLTVGWLVAPLPTPRRAVPPVPARLPARAPRCAARLPPAVRRRRRASSTDSSTRCPRSAGSTSSIRVLVRFYNPVAAMPSLHVAFAVVTGAEIAERSDSVRRAVGGACVRAARRDRRGRDGQPLRARRGRRSRSRCDRAAALLTVPTRQSQVSDDRSTGFVVPSGWRAVLGVAAAVLLVVGVGLLLARAAGFAEVRDAIESADSTWFVVCLAAQVLALVRLRRRCSAAASPGAHGPIRASG